jgi:hypothetical protein
VCFDPCRKGICINGLVNESAREILARSDSDCDKL